MILRILLLACTVLGTYSLSGMLTPVEFKKFKDMCFQNDPFQINGQENPLSNSMENFIALAEKFEAANPNILLKDELFYFLRNYTYENIDLRPEGPVPWPISNTDMSEIKKLWEPERDNINRQQQQLNDPFTDGETCSLYYMISHSIVKKPAPIEPMNARSMGNTSSDRIYRTDLNIDDYYPQEIGVVAIRGTEEAVSVSRVLVGLYVGLNQNRKQDLRSFDRLKDAPIPQDELPTETTVDPLYSLTLAEVMVLSAWEVFNRRGMEGDGQWMSGPKGIESFCPMVYKHDSGALAYSYSSMRGAADGLILGTIVRSIESQKQNIKLSQLLRMYYSVEGIAVEQNTPDIQVPRVSFCNRQDVIDPFTSNLEIQMHLYALLVSDDFTVLRDVQAAKDLYQRIRGLSFRRNNRALQDYCSKALNVETPEELPRETSLDVIVVMDSSTDVAFQTQQKITGYLASYLDLRYTGSRMSIFLDQKLNGDSSSAQIDLKPVVADEYSSSCAACTVGQISYEKSTLEKDQIVLAVHQLLEDRKANETKFNGANGKVVVFFNFESDVRDNNRVQGRLDKALRELFTKHRNLHVYAVGLETESLKKFARNDPASVFLAADGNEQEVAQKLYEKISGDPGLLQYSDCEEGRGESSAVYENFVSPYGIQHWEMPAEYFYKSKKAKITFESTGGAIKVCKNRATMKPENEAKSCNTTLNTKRQTEIDLSYPCTSFTKETCAPLYIAVIGMNSNGDTNRQANKFCDDINDKWCSKLDSIKFKVTHEGIRCSGCLGLGAPPMAILLAMLLSYILHRMF